MDSIMKTKPKSAWAVIGVMAAIFLGASVAGGLFSAPFLVLSKGVTNPLFMFVSYTIMFTLAVLLGALWLRSMGELRLRWGVSWSAAPMILLGVAAMMAASYIIEPLILWFPSKWLDQIDQMIGSGGWSILMLVVAAPLLEEMFCRGLLLETLSHRWRPWAAVLASAAFFGIVHFNIPQGINAFVLAIVMGYLYLATRSLIPVIVIHAINNALSYLQRELTGSQIVSTREMLNNDTLYWMLYAASVVIVIASLVFLDRLVRTKTAEITLETKTTGDDQ
jgi:membrane protease YdiL (CAAX protease family)